uniref:MI domain-containing protein n=1 Tax=Clytia hemisphaerica TaxID=252671 RepID=A0A7M5V9Z0_9CNID|eukprot:TCONS_00015265-protein
MDKSEEKDLRNAVKNAKTAFYKDKGKQKQVFRREARRNKRVEKKAKHHQFMLKKSGATVTEEKPEKKVKKRKKRKRKAQTKVAEGEGDEEGSLSYERYAYEAANKQDENLIASLGKKLGLNKTKNQLKKMDEDGLDYLLEVCEPFGAGGAGGEGDDAGANDSDEEYLRMKKAKKLKSSKNEKSSKPTKQVTKEGNDKTTEAKRKEKLLFGEEEANDGEFDEDDLGDLEDEFAVLEGLHDDDDENEDDENMSGGEFSEEEFEQGEDFEEGEDSEEGENLEKEQDGESDGEDNSSKQSTKEKKAVEKHVTTAVSGGKYIPPALRKLQSKGEDEEKVKIERLKKQLKGLLNRVSESTLPGITSEIALLYEKNSRYTMNELMFQAICDSCVAEALTPHRLMIQLMVIVASLHKTSQCEIGSYFLQMLVEKFNTLHKVDEMEYNLDKKCANVLYLILTLYNLKVVESLLIYDIVRRLMSRFNEQDIELILMILKTCGPDMRKDDPFALKEIILAIQAKSMASEAEDQSRVKFMLETINALKNNNMRKVPQYDPTLIEDGRKIYKAITRGRETMNSGSQLKVSLEDLLNARDKGKWWVVGSAWAGRGPNKTPEEKVVDEGGIQVPDASAKLLEKAKKQRMNTELRKNIFCILMTSEDYLDAFEKLQKLSLKEKQAREIIHVVLDCCLQEKTYNPFYAHLADQFCGHSHSNKITLQYSLWDRFKTLSTLSKHTCNNMAHLMSHLIASNSLTLGVLKVVSFGMLDKQSIRFFTSFFKILLLQYPESSIKSAFMKIASNTKLASLREGIKIFLRSFIAPRKDEDTNIAMKDRKMNELIDLVESALDGREYIPL